MTENIEEDNHRERSRGDGESGGCCSWKFCWWNPPQEALVSEFFNESSLHGLKYIGQPKRHITERIFWFLAFVIGVVAASILIYAMVLRYENTPVVVSFQSEEQLIETIPFPAVTFCNINQFSRKKVKELERVASLPTHEDYEMAKRNLSLVGSFCQSQKSFAQNSDFAYNRGDPKILDYSNYDKIQKNMMDFLVDNTVPCDEMMRLCMFEGSTLSECSTMFEPVVTEFGKCCTFNMLPLPLLLKNPSNEGKKNASILNNPALGTRLTWDDEEIALWSMWNYDKGFILPPPNYHDPQPGDIYLPIRQHGPGKAYGFSVLLDPMTEDYYCPMSDGQGILFTLHTAVELPNVKEFPSVIDSNKEVYVKIFPELTFADDDIRDLKSEKRQCYFGKEKKLKLFAPYTRENCMDDCVADYIAQECRCAFFYMPRDEGVKVCNTDVESEDGECVQEIRGAMRALKNKLCGHCLALCEDIEYRFETTTVTLQNATQLWHDMGPIHKDQLPEWADHKVSIVHIFFGTPAVVAKLRKRLYGITDLIANTGGILGLCLGFSVLSAAEVVYFVLVRALWKYCNRSRRYGCCRRSRKQRPASASASIMLQQQIEAAPIFQFPASFNQASSQ
ncbi:unnamed protein product [Orchesella dallaii]|uniref:Pickpocket protein 28 n=1 Tax=Orchesella dallaii TaxID=48710 RepID=A0ABP1RIE8_9HEXA